jgi:hypothetical protein
MEAFWKPVGYCVLAVSRTEGDETALTAVFEQDLWLVVQGGVVEG